MINMCIICIDEINHVDSSIVNNALEISRSISMNPPPQGLLLIDFSFL